VETIEFISYSVAQTTATGRRLGERLRAGDVICLSGNLGAGKTALAKGIGAGWGALETMTSPTFTLIHEHHRARDDQTLYHVDCYRLEGHADAWGIGLEDLFYGDGPVVIEWPENIREALPPDHLWIALDFLGDTQRHLTARATGEHYRALLAALDGD
jgi:tRNA threonylcarbamoyladenosine biosynthesis protein TsaE